MSSAAYLVLLAGRQGLAQQVLILLIVDFQHASLQADLAMVDAVGCMLL